MKSPMIKTSITLPRHDLEQAHELGINVSELAREALRDRLADEVLDREIDGYVTAFQEWDEHRWDRLAGDGLVAEGPV